MVRQPFPLVKTYWQVRLGILVGIARLFEKRTNPQMTFATVSEHIMASLRLSIGEFCYTVVMYT